MNGRLLVRGGRILGRGDPIEGDLAVIDGAIADERVMHRLVEEHEGSRAADAVATTVIDASGATVLPLVTRSVVEESGEGLDSLLAPGAEASFAVVRGAESRARLLDTFIVVPRDLVALVVSGRVEAVDGEATHAPGADDPARWHGTWSDPSKAIDQHLLPGGRYTETRSGRRDAYTGRFWTRGDRIVYLDDTGFWAHGELWNGVLHHAGFVMRRRGDQDDGAHHARSDGRNDVKAEVPESKAGDGRRPDIRTRRRAGSTAGDGASAR